MTRREVCRACDKTRSLRKDGTFQRHTVSAGLRILCKGSGQRPDAVSTYEHGDGRGESPVPEARTDA